jgi:hypothetical protein
MRRLCVIAVVLSAVGACSAPSASGQAPITRQEATQTFVIARAIEVRAIGTVFNTGLARMEADGAEIAAGCSGLLAHAPAGHDAAEFSTELEFALLLTMYRPLHEAISGFAGAMVEDHLRWRDGRLQRVVYTYVREQASFISLQIPDVCSDARVWATSGYTTLSSETTRFVTELRNVIDGQTRGTKERLISALGRHMTRSESAVLGRTMRLEATQASLLLSRWTSSITTVSGSLGLPASERPRAVASHVPVV